MLHFIKLVQTFFSLQGLLLLFLEIVSWRVSDKIIGFNCWPLLVTLYMGRSSRKTTKGVFNFILVHFAGPA